MAGLRLKESGDFNSEVAAVHPENYIRRFMSHLVREARGRRKAPLPPEQERAEAGRASVATGHRASPPLPRRPLAARPHPLPWRRASRPALAPARP